ncbi:MAG: outer membrane lipoprotein-sorting protein [Candidatus Bipolaricaulota bacterium]
MKFVALLFALGFLSLACSGAQPGAADLLEKARAMWRGETFQATVTLDVTRAGETTQYRFQVWAQGEDLALVRVLAPDAEAGSGYLLAGEELWYYTPAAGRAISLPPFALFAGFLGSGLDLDEVLRGATTEHYTVEFSPDQPEAGHRITLTPLPEAATVYGRIEVTLREDLALAAMIYYDQRDQVIKTAHALEFLELPGRVLPRVIVVEESSGDRTVQTFEELLVDVPIEPSVFTREYLERQ